MTSLDDAEYQRLQAEISDAERLFASNPKITRAIVETFAHPLKQRSEQLEQDGALEGFHSEKKKSDAVLAVAIAQLVAQESQLSHSERQSYADFLRKKFFSNSDIQSLEGFYEENGAFDRLSKRGKDEMTIRMAEGIERGALDTSKLSPSLLDKHLGHLNAMMKEDQPHPIISAIPGDRREAFAREYDAGSHSQAQELLSSVTPFDSMKESQKNSPSRVEAGPRSGRFETEKTQSKDSAKENPNLSDAQFFDSLENAPKSATDLPIPQSQPPQKGS